MPNNRLLYMRLGPYVLDFDSYNLQEVGLGKAFCKCGFDVDILYYSMVDKDQIIPTENGTLKILWRKGIKWLRTGLYPSMTSRFLCRYAVVMTSEYSQILSWWVAKQHPNVYLYNGPYYNLFKFSFIEPIYDRLFCRSIDMNVRKVFCKTKLSKAYIEKKGIADSIVVGVGLDIDKYEKENSIETETKALLSKMEGHRNLLYVGQMIKRKNVDLLIKAFLEVKKRAPNVDIQLVLIGKGDDQYMDYCKSMIVPGLRKNVIWCGSIKNAQMKFIYQAATMFLLPSAQEIFGMVLLEAMYFSLPVISSYNAGADTLIKSGENGVIMDTFNEIAWADQIIRLLSDKSVALRMGRAAGERIRNEFMWDNIVNKMLRYIRYGEG